MSIKRVDGGPNHLGDTVPGGTRVGAAKVGGEGRTTAADKPVVQAPARAASGAERARAADDGVDVRAGRAVLSDEAKSAYEQRGAPLAVLERMRAMLAGLARASGAGSERGEINVVVPAAKPFFSDLTMTANSLSALNTDLREALGGEAEAVSAAWEGVVGLTAAMETQRWPGRDPMARRQVVEAVGLAVARGDLKELPAAAQKGLEGLIGRDLQTDVNALVQWVLRESYMQTTYELRFFADKVRFYNDAKKKLRQEAINVGNILAQYSGEEDTVDLDPPYQPTPIDENYYPGGRDSHAEAGNARGDGSGAGVATDTLTTDSGAGAGGGGDASTTAANSAVQEPTGTEVGAGAAGLVQPPSVLAQDLATSSPDNGEQAMKWLSKLPQLQGDEARIFLEAIKAGGVTVSSPVGRMRLDLSSCVSLGQVMAIVHGKIMQLGTHPQHGLRGVTVDIPVPAAAMPPPPQVLVDGTYASSAAAQTLLAQDSTTVVHAIEWLKDAGKLTGADAEVFCHTLVTQGIEVTINGVTQTFRPRPDWNLTTLVNVASGWLGGLAPLAQLGGRVRVDVPKPAAAIPAGKELVQGGGETVGKNNGYAEWPGKNGDVTVFAKTYAESVRRSLGDMSEAEKAALLAQVQRDGKLSLSFSVKPHKDWLGNAHAVGDTVSVPFPAQGDFEALRKAVVALITLAGAGAQSKLGQAPHYVDLGFELPAFTALVDDDPNVSHSEPTPLGTDLGVLADLESVKPGAPLIERFEQHAASVIDELRSLPPEQRDAFLAHVDKHGFAIEIAMTGTNGRTEHMAARLELAEGTFEDVLAQIEKAIGVAATDLYRHWNNGIGEAQGLSEATFDIRLPRFDYRTPAIEAEQRPGFITTAGVKEFPNGCPARGVEDAVQASIDELLGQLEQLPADQQAGVLAWFRQNGASVNWGVQPPKGASLETFLAGLGVAVAGAFSFGAGWVAGAAWLSAGAALGGTGTAVGGAIWDRDQQSRRESQDYARELARIQNTYDNAIANLPASGRVNDTTAVESETFAELLNDLRAFYESKKDELVEKNGGPGAPAEFVLAPLSFPEFYFRSGCETLAQLEAGGAPRPATGESGGAAPGASIVSSSSGLDEGGAEGSDAPPTAPTVETASAGGFVAGDGVFNFNGNNAPGETTAWASDHVSTIMGELEDMSPEEQQAFLAYIKDHPKEITWLAVTQADIGDPSRCSVTFKVEARANDTWESFTERLERQLTSRAKELFANYGGADAAWSHVDLTFKVPRFSYERTVTPEAEGATGPGAPRGDADPCRTKGELLAYQKEIEERLNSVGDDAQLANVDLQNILQKQQQTLQMMSNISKMLHDTAQAIIRKIGG